ncbi:DUF2341 domain-containing protein [Candidatus Peregrinibacteria bacterium]|nr:DUF2341 domain-containing protein [Candidatus Peregrinibacteria bacterium]
MISIFSSKKFAIGTLFITGVFSFSPFFANTAHAAGESWYNTSWTYRKKITFTADAAKIPSALTNFPALVSVTDTDLRDKAQSDADDILFTASDGTTKLSHEIEKYTSSTGQIFAWVKIPSLATSTVIYMYYGNSSAASQQNKTDTWDGHYYDVYHFAEASGNITDSALGVTGTVSGTVTLNVPGQMGTAGTFDGSTGSFSLGNPPAMDFRNSITIEGWIKTANPTTRQTIVGRSTSSVDIQYLFGISQIQSSKLGFESQLNAGAISAASNTALLANTWYYAAVTFDGSTAKFYLNGVADGSVSQSGTMNPQSTDTLIGKKNLFGDYFDGSMDELRFSVSARSADWITANYQNQSNPSAFFTYAVEEIYQMNITGTATQTAGTPQTITLTARDYAGNTITSFSGDKSIIFSGANAAPNGATPTCTDKYGTATNFGSSTLITFTNGVGTCNLTLYKAENAAVTFTTGGAVFTRGTLAVTVSGAALNNFLVDTPAAGTSTVAFSTTVTSRDAYNNVTKQVTGASAISVNSQGASVTPTSIDASQFTDDGVWTGDVTVSNALAGASAIVTITNGAVTGSDVIVLTAAPSSPSSPTSPSPTSPSPTAPNIPINGTTTAVGTSSMTVSWDAHLNTDTTEYFVENTTNATTSGWITGISWNATGLTCATSYTFRVKARSGVGNESSFSSDITASTLACPSTSVHETPSPPPVSLFKDIDKLKESDQKNIVSIVQFMLDQKTYKVPKNKKYQPKIIVKGLAALQMVNALAEVGCKEGCKKAAVKAELVKDKFDLKKKVTRLDMYEMLLKARGAKLESADPDDLKDVCEDEKKATKREASIFFTARKYKIAKKYKGSSCKLDKGFSKVEAAYFAVKAKEIEKKSEKK